MSKLSLSLLGSFQASLEKDPLTDFRTNKVQALLIYLVSEPEPHNRDMLLDLFWPGLPEKSARSNLRQILYYLRRDIPEVVGKDDRDVPLVIANRQEIGLNPQAALIVDTWQFEDLLESTHAHEHLDLFLCQACAEELEEAADLYRGDFLAGFYLDDSNVFEDWARARREYFRRKALDTMGILATMAIRRREYSKAHAYAERQLEIDNLRESAYRQLMEVLALSGRREQAVAAYETCRQVLMEEVGMAPSARTTGVYEKILAGDLSFDRFPEQGVRGYELKEQIGEGSYGTIHLGVQPAILREVAVKVIRRKYADDPDFIRRFEAEAQIIARLEHPHIVPLYDYWRDPQGAYLVMRHMRGGSLLTELKTGPWDVERTANMLEQVAGALAIAHRQGVVHRDIKPGNILLDEAGNAYLADFGIAKDLTSEEHMTAEGAVVGTLDYTSPEQIMSEEVTPQTDIYSMGAVLYEALTGEKPFGDATVAKLIHSHLHEPIPLVAATRPDIPPEVDTVLQRATAKNSAERYATVLEMAAAFRLAARGAEPVLEAEGREEETIPAIAEVYNPYKGLQAFQESDADDFFGREALVQQLVDRLGGAGNGAGSRFLAVVGPSGSGKSSTVKAGLIPALRQGALPGSEDWFIIEMVPGTNPLAELELALWRVAVDPPPDLVQPMQRDTGGILRTVRRILPRETAPHESEPQLLLVIDQFEELFTLVEDEAQRTFFLEGLLEAIEAPRSPLRVLITLRADFYDRPLQHPEWGQLLKQHTEIVLPLNRTELTWAVRKPAQRMGVRIERSLATTIVSDVADQPGALPLLQYAMTELFEHRQEGEITGAAYEQLGGVQGALGRRAEALYTELDDAGKEVARQLFLRLITLGEGVEDTRRRVLRSELEALAGEEVAELGESSPITRVLDRFAAARFLTFDRDQLTRAPTVEVAHEALLNEWPRLRTWLADSRHDVRLQRLLAQAAGEWLAADRDAGYLLRDARLDQFADWAENTSVALTTDERALVAASVAARQDRLSAEEERRQRELQAAQELAETQQKRADDQARAAGRLRQRAVYLTVALVVAAILAVLAVGASRQSSINAAEARVNANAAATNAAQSAANAALAQTRQAEEALQRAAAEQAQATAVAAQAIADREREIAQEQAHLATSRELSQAALNALDSDPELSILLALQALETAYTKEAEEALHRALQTSRTLLAITPFKGDTVDRVAYSPNGQQLATTSVNGILQVREAATGQELLSTPTSGWALLSPIYDSDGSRLTLLSVAPDYQYMTLETWDAVSGAPVITHTLPVTWDLFAGVDLSPDFSLLAVGYEDGSAALWDVATATKLVTLPPLGDLIFTAGFSPDGTKLLLGSRNGQVAVWDVPAVVAGASTAPDLVFNAGGGVTGVTRHAFSADGARVAVGAGLRVEVWNLSEPAQPQFSLYSDQTLLILDVEFSADGSLLAAASLDGTVAVWKLDEGRPLYTLVGHAAAVHDVAFSPDAHRLATVSGDGTVRIWDAAPLGGGERGHYATRSGIIRDVELSPDGQALALGTNTGPALLLQASTGEQLLQLVGEPETGVYRVAFHPDGHRLATVGEDNVIRVWDRETGEVLRAWTGHGEGVSGGLFFGTIDVVFSPDGSRLATAGTDGVAKVWDTESGDELLALEGHTAGLHSIAYSPDGRWIATSSDGPDKSVKVWDAATGAEVYSLEGHPARVWALAFSPDSSLLATGGSQGVVKLWDLGTGEERYTLPSQVSTVGMIAFTPDGTKMITGGKALRVWDVATGIELLTLADLNPRFDLSADGRHLFTGDGKGAVRVYVLPLDDTVALAHERLTRWWTPQECQEYLHQEDCPADDVRVKP